MKRLRKAQDGRSVWVCVCVYEEEDIVLHTHPYTVYTHNPIGVSVGVRVCVCVYVHAVQLRYTCVEFRSAHDSAKLGAWGGRGRVRHSNIRLVYSEVGAVIEKLNRGLNEFSFNLKWVGEFNKHQTNETLNCLAVL